MAEPPRRSAARRDSPGAPPSSIAPGGAPTFCNPACHGCRHRGWPEAASVAQKQRYLARALAPWADGLEALVPAPAGRRSAYRDRVTLTADWSAAAGWQFGLMRRDVLIPIPDCPVHTPRVRALVHLLMAGLPAPDRLPVAYLHVAGAQATLVVRAPEVPAGALDGVLPGLAAVGVEGLWINCNPSAGRRLFLRRKWHLVWGQARSCSESGLLYGPESFQQLLPELHDRAMAEAQAWLAPGPGDRLLDLYCGTGSTLRRFAATGARVLGIETGREAGECARANAPGVTFLAGTGTARLPQLRPWWQADGARRLLHVNPPRSGIEPPVLDALASELRPERIAYLSCSAGTLGRDLARLEAAGYRVARLLPFDFFPQTHHVEVLALLTRP